MSRTIIILAISLLLGGVLFVVWMLSLPPAPPHLSHSPEREVSYISRSASGDVWQRYSVPRSDMPGLVSIKDGGVIWYGDISGGYDTKTKVPTIGKWIVSIVDYEGPLILQTDSLRLDLRSEGSVYVNFGTSKIINFDMGSLVVNDINLPPSFLLQGDQKSFFDVGENTHLGDENVWSVFRAFFLSDESTLYGDISQQDLQRLIDGFLAREPKKGSGLVQYDISVRRSLEEISERIQALSTDKNCIISSAQCLTLLADATAKLKNYDREIYTTLNFALQGWLKKQKKSLNTSWESLFHNYLRNILSGDPRAKSTRDKAILSTIARSKSSANENIWEYLTQMLAGQKIGSIYSLKIINEMIRIGDELFTQNTHSPQKKSLFVDGAMTSLGNLRNVLEATYFTKKQYLYILREDLHDEEGVGVQAKVFLEDFDNLIQKIHTTQLFQSLETDEQKKAFAVISGQLVWFDCIFKKNEAYRANPRVCRITGE